MLKILCHLLNLPVKRVMYDQHGHPGFNMEAAIQTLREGQDLTSKPPQIKQVTEAVYRADWSSIWQKMIRQIVKLVPPRKTAQLKSRCMN